MYKNNLKITAQIKLFDKSRKLKKEFLVIQSNEATLKSTKALTFEI